MRRLVTCFFVIPILSVLAAPVAAQSPTATEALLAGMVTEEVEPGVFRVDNDGVRDLSGIGTWGLNSLAIAPDGVVWVCSERTARPFPLGESEAQMVACPVLSMAVAADGSVWLIDLDSDSIRSFDGATWAEHGSRAQDGRVWRDLSTAPDGTVWTTALETECPTDLKPCNERVLVRIDADGAITDVAVGPDIIDQPLWIDDLAVAPDGDVWMTVLVQHGGWDVATLLRYDGAAWEAVAPPQGTLSQNDVSGQALGFAPDGTLWIGTGSTPDGNTGLARLDDSGWTIFSNEDGVRPWGTAHRWIFLADLAVAPDGSVWVNAASEDPMDGGCGGVARFDGAMWTTYLVGTCVDDLDIAHDGAVWVVGESEETAYAGSGSTDLYVITPEAVAAAE